MKIQEIRIVRTYWNIEVDHTSLYSQNTIAKPSSSPTLHDSKVTSRADSVADRKPYGQWVPFGKYSSKK